jgi:hypothetical protein
MSGLTVRQWLDVQGVDKLRSEHETTQGRNKEHSGIMCPNCEDTMDSDVTQLRPTWSDYYDDVVCLTCAEEMLPRV